MRYFAPVAGLVVGLTRVLFEVDGFKLGVFLEVGKCL